MKKVEIVKKEQDFNNIILSGKKISNKFWYVFFKENNLIYPRFGIAVGTKIGNAVIRNKYKRRAKNIIDKNKIVFQNGYDYIIMLRKACIGLTYQELEESLLNACKKEIQ